MVVVVVVDRVQPRCWVHALLLCFFLLLLGGGGGGKQQPGCRGAGYLRFLLFFAFLWVVSGG